MKSKILSLALMIHIGSTLGQTITTAYAYSENKDSNINCKLSNVSATSAVESALRYNRINIDNSNRGYGLPKFYVNVINWEITRETCGYSAQLKVSNYENVKIPNSNKQIFSEVIFCSITSAGHTSKVDMQTTINSLFKNYVDECISEIEKNARLK